MSALPRISGKERPPPLMPAPRSPCTAKPFSHRSSAQLLSQKQRSPASPHPHHPESHTMVPSTRHSSLPPAQRPSAPVPQINEMSGHWVSKVPLSRTHRTDHHQLSRGALPRPRTLSRQDWPIVSQKIDQDSLWSFFFDNWKLCCDKSQRKKKTAFPSSAPSASTPAPAQSAQPRWASRWHFARSICLT